MKIYFNLKTAYGVETIDELDPKDFATLREFYAELLRLRREYDYSGISVYISSRCTKQWRSRL